MKLLVNHSEITLKGRNRPFFEQKLARNIMHVLGKAKITNLHGRFLVEVTGNTLPQFNHIFGVANYSIINESTGVIALEKSLITVLSKRTPFATFAVRTKRAYKQGSLSSQEINIRLGDLISTKLKKKVDLTNPDLTIFVEIHKDALWFYFKKHEGPHGLPVDTSGKVLSLLSGGIDSPVSSYLMAKRGCRVDYIHFHAFSDNELAVKSKISETVKALQIYTLYSTIYFVPYTEFQMQIIGTNTEYELILFRRFMLRVAKELAVKNGHKALVTGDNLGQVASQTLDNLSATEQAVELPVFRPLIGYNKNEIVDLARSIGTYELSVQKYKDCCSIIQKHPKTIAHLDKILKDEKKLQLDRLIKNTIAKSILV
jgi:tRNA uracil 4-sulfurtransferase